MKNQAAKNIHSSFDRANTLLVIEQVFSELFETRFKTRLQRGAAEPLYLPSVLSPAEVDQSLYSGIRQLALSAIDQGMSIVFFREDYVASALHELAHWCIAGARRRGLLDYGYWYEPDGRNEQQQVEFELVEVKPQAIEWMLSKACNLTFQLSSDNLELESGPSETFKKRVYEQVVNYCNGSLPERAEMLTSRIAIEFETNPLRPENYLLDDLS